MKKQKGFTLAEVAIALAAFAVITLAAIGWQVNEVKHDKAKELATALLALDTAFYQLNSAASYIPVPASATKSQTTSPQWDTDFVCVLRNTASLSNTLPVNTTTTISISIGDKFGPLFRIPNFVQMLDFRAFSKPDSRVQDDEYSNGKYGSSVVRRRHLLVINPVTKQCHSMNAFREYAYWNYVGLGMDRINLYYDEQAKMYRCKGYNQGGWGVNFRKSVDTLIEGLPDLSDPSSCGVYGIGRFVGRYVGDPNPNIGIPIAAEILLKPPYYTYYYIDCDPEGSITAKNGFYYSISGYGGYYGRDYLKGSSPIQIQLQPVNTSDTIYSISNTNTNTNLPKNLLDPRLDFKTLAKQGYTFTFNVTNNKLNSITISGIDEDTSEYLANILGSKWDKNTRTYYLNQGKGYEIRPNSNIVCGG